MEAELALAPAFASCLKALPKRFVVSFVLSHGEGSKLVKMES